MSTPAIFKHYPLGSAAYAEQRLFLRGKTVTHLRPHTIRAVGHKYITTDLGTQFQHFPGMDWLTAKGGTEAATGMGWRLFHDSPEIQARLLQEAHEVALANEAHALDENLRDQLLNGTLDEATCRRIVQFLLDRGLLTWSSLASGESHLLGKVSLADLRMLTSPTPMHFEITYVDEHDLNNSAVLPSRTVLSILHSAFWKDELESVSEDLEHGGFVVLSMARLPSPTPSNRGERSDHGDT